MTRASRLLVVLVGLLLGLAQGGHAQAAPPWWLDGLGQYRVVDASGRIAPRAPAGPGDRVALRPAYPPSPLLRGRPFYLSGYAGASYARPRVTVGPLEPAGYQVRAGHFHHGR